MIYNHIGGGGEVGSLCSSLAKCRPLVRMVLACHYDSKLEPRGGVFTTDSAAPCAMMLNLAKTMREELRQQRRRSEGEDLTLQFLFFDGEEAFKRWTSTDSIYGSRRLAQDWEKQAYSHGGVTGNHNDRIDIFVLLDLLGARDMTLSKLETSTGDWYDNLVRIERSLKQRNLVQGSNIFNVSYKIFCYFTILLKLFISSLFILSSELTVKYIFRATFFLLE